MSDVPPPAERLLGDYGGDNAQPGRLTIVNQPVNVANFQLHPTGGSTNFSTTTGIKKIIEAIAANEHMELYDRCQSKPEGVIDLKLETNKIRIEDTIAAEVDKKLKAMNIGALPSATVTNTREHNNVSVVTTRRGKSEEVVEEVDEERDQLIEVDLEIKENEVVREEVATPKPVVKETGIKPKPVVKLPFPTQNKKKGQHEIFFEKFLELFKKLEINISLLEALEQMPTYAKFMKVIIFKRRTADTNPIILTETCSAILQGMKIPIKKKDRGAVTIPCTIGDRSFNKALIDLGSSVSLMPLPIYKKLGIGAVQDTRMTLQFADHSVKKPYGIVEDILVKIDKFVFPVDFVILEMPEDEEIPLILGRPFLETGRCLINIEEGTMTLKVYDEELKIDVRNTMRYKDDICTSHTIEVLDQVTTFDNLLPTPQSPLEKVLSLSIFESDKEVYNEDSEVLSLLDTQTPWKGSRPRRWEELCLPSSSEENEELKKETKLKQLPDNLKYVFLQPGGKCPAIINSSLQDIQEEKLIQVLKKYKTAIGWKIEDLKGISPTVCMHKILMEDDPKPVVQPQRRLNPTMKEVVWKEVVKLLDADKCQKTNLILNWEKCHFMVREGIVVGHKISYKGIEVDQVKVEVISKLPPPMNEKGIRSFLGHTGFYRRFIRDFSKIAKPLTTLLVKDKAFLFDKECTMAFETLKRKLISAPIVIAPYWSLPFEIMCDASDIAVGAVLGQRREKLLHVIYYASHVLNPTQMNYATMEKDLLAVVYAFDKFRQYLLGSKVIVYMDHGALKYLFAKQDSKPRLLRWILLIQEFDVEIRDKRGCENTLAVHLSRMSPIEETEEKRPIKDEFADEHILAVIGVPWFADYANYLVGGVMPNNFDSNKKKKFVHDCRFYLWDDPFLYKRGVGGLIRRCVPEEEQRDVLRACHDSE
ncbi:uncharacterized protein LOC127109227 [Lathyrus oleraceus]|uniref:uncharacterized protein LOC127109227 n=1 Tax=Pisum sativum TaxID=3888 RepID=UPI0021D18C7B|nr:uncharacterized protein LOC127109227 [Pisum sativum]